MALLVVGSAHAQQASYTWSGTGTNVAGATKCGSYKMKIDVTVDGSAVKGVFVQDGRTERHFEATTAAGGVFKTKCFSRAGAWRDRALARARRVQTVRAARDRKSVV